MINRNKALRKDKWMHPSYKLYLIALAFSSIPLILFGYNQGIGILFILASIIYIIFILVILNEQVNTKKIKKKTFYGINSNIAVTNLDSILNNKRFEFNKKNEIKNQSFQKYLASELYEIKNKELFIKIISNAETQNSIDIMIYNILKNNTKTADLIMKEIDNKFLTN